MKKVTILRCFSYLLVWAMFISMCTVSVPVYAAENPCKDLIISEYVEGGGSNKVIEIYNGTGDAVSLGNYSLRIYFNGKTTYNSYSFPDQQLNDGDTFVVGNGNAIGAMKVLFDDENGNINHNGDDAYELVNGGDVIDSIGQVGFDPGSQWSSNGVGTQDKTLVRISTVLNGDKDSSDVFDPSLEWEASPKDTYSDLGMHTMDNNSLPQEQVADVTANVESGEVPENTLVELSTDTVDADIYFTLDDSEPTTGSTLYSEAIAINEAKTIKAFAVKDGYIDGNVATYNYTVEVVEPPAWITIAEARALFIDETVVDKSVTVKGIVTSLDGKIFIEDNTAGINLYSGDTTGLSIGDEIVVSGTVISHYGLEEISPFTVDEIVSSDNPLPLNDGLSAEDFTGDAAEALEGTRVKIGSVAVVAGSYGNYEATDDTGTVLVDPKASGSDTWLEAGSYDSIVGVVNYEYGAYEIMPVSTSDIVESTGGTDYYEGTEGLEGDALKAFLNDLIDGHNVRTYSQAYDDLIITDADPDQSGNVILFYSGTSVNGAMQYNGGAGWNREHTWAKSHGDFGTAMGPGTDLHQLRATDVDVNSARNHYDFAELDESASGVVLVDETTDCYVIRYGDEREGLFEPREEVKGDVARILFYMATRYEGEADDYVNVDLELSNSELSIAQTVSGVYGEHGVLDVLLAWHEADPVDALELARNEAIYGIQGNRNPYIDHPEFVAKIWESTVVEPEVITIAEARATDGEVVIVEGIVTTLQGAGSSKAFYMQDDTAGVLVYTGTLYNLAIGDSIRVSGTTENYYDHQFELIDVTAVEVLSTGGSEPEPVTSLDLTESVEAELVKVETAVIDTVTKANDYGSTAITLKNYGFDVFIDNRTGLKFDDVTLAEGDVVDLTGIAASRGATTFRLELRGSGDIVASSVVDTTPPVIVHTDVTDGNVAADLAVNATVTDELAVGHVTLYYKTVGAADYEQMDMLNDDGDNYAATIAAASLSTDGLVYYIEARDMMANQTRYPETGEIAVAISDDDITAPVITSVVPGHGDTLEDTMLRPGVTVSFEDVSDIATVTMSVDGADVSNDVVVTSTTMSWQSASDMTLGEHTIAVTLSDVHNNTTSKTWTFTIGQASYDLYFGQLHAHSTFSDGQGTADEAYTQARYEGGADFFALTDHSNWFDNELDSENITSVLESTSNTWKSLHAEADAHNVDGEFVAIAGFEMTWSGSTGGWGHINTFNTPWFVSRSNSSMDLEAYYNKLAEPANNMSINQLNHPGKTFGNFGDFGFYSEEVDNVVQLIEVGNGEGPIRGTGYFTSYEMYTRALDKGWHIAPSNNQDNHKGNFIISNEARTVVMASELTRQGIFNAIDELRVYATEDSNLEIIYEVNGMPMGSRLDDPTELNIHVDVYDPDVADGIESISLISDAGVVSATTDADGNQETWDLVLPAQYAYYYVKVVSDDGDIAVTAPVWASEVMPIGVSAVEASENPTIVNNTIDVSATVFNNAADALNNVEVKFYQESVAPENLIDSNTISTVAAGGTEVAAISWSTTEAGTYTIYAQTTVNVDGAPKTFTNSMQVKVYSEEDAKVILVDAGHQNMYVSGSYANRTTGFKDMLAAKNLIYRTNDDVLEASDLVGIEALVITDPASEDNQKYGYTKSKFTEAELQVIADYVAAGGDLIITSYSDNYEGVGEYQNSVQGNVVLEAIGSNLRFNDDEVWDETNNDGGTQWKLLLNDMQSPMYQIFDDNIPMDYRIYRASSVILKDGGNDSAVDWLVRAHDTSFSKDDDGAGDNTPVNAGELYVLAAEVLPSGGKVVVAGSTLFSDFEITGDNQFANNPITEGILDWVAPKKAVELVKIAELKLDENEDGILDLTGKTYQVEGYVTAESEETSKLNGRKNAFFEVIYVQDETGGITVFGVSTTDLPIGTKVRIEGTVEQYDGDGELALSNELTQVTVLADAPVVQVPQEMTTADSMLESNEGWLVQIEGTVTRMTDNALYLDDGSGEARVYVNGYIDDGSGDPNMQGKWDSTIAVGDTVSAIGLASEDPEGHRLRVRNTAEIILVAVGDTTPPVITIEPYTTTPTNDSIVVKASTNEGTLNATEHTFVENSSFTFIATDAAGNVAETTVTITNIDRTAPSIIITGYNTDPINESITVNAITDDPLATLNASSYTFEENGSFTFIATDQAGNVTVLMISIINIDKVPPIITFNDYTTSPTNEDITVTATVDSGWLVEDTYTFTENGDYEFEARDTAGNITKVTVTITNIDKTAPVITVEPYDTTPTNEDVVVKASVTEGDSLNTTEHTFTENGSFTFEASDEAGNTASETVTISHIDKEAPVITILPYDTRKNRRSVWVFALTDEGTLNKNVHVFTENGSFTFIATDEAGNVTEETVTITNIKVRGNSGNSNSGSGNSNSGSGNPSSEPVVEIDDEVLPEAAGKAFSDVVNHWAKSHIDKLTLSGVLGGYPDGTFKPEGTVTRAEFIKMIVETLELEDDGTEVTIPSDAENHWAISYVEIALQKGLTDGFSEDLFRPDDKITREQMAVVLYNALELKPVDSETAFDDLDEIASWAVDAVGAVAEAGYIEGYEDDTFRPKGLMTRAEAATVIARLIED